jgi:TM2 domain-containing membrane protein YozV
MPTCRYCHKEISAFDKDVCPYCGEPHPIDENYKTKDMTQFVDPVTGNYKLYKSKTRKTAGLLCLFLGWSGAQYFYLEELKRGIIAIVVTLLVTGGLGAALFFLVPVLHNALAFVIPFAANWLFYIGWSFVFFFKDSLKDGNGEFLR